MLFAPAANSLAPRSDGQVVLVTSLHSGIASLDAGKADHADDDSFSSVSRRDAARFLSGLAHNNTKEWFEANRALYEAGYVEPARRFVEAVGPV